MIKWRDEIIIAFNNEITLNDQFVKNCPDNGHLYTTGGQQFKNKLLLKVYLILDSFYETDYQSYQQLPNKNSSMLLLKEIEYYETSCHLKKKFNTNVSCRWG